MARKKDSRLTRAGVSGYNKPKRTPNHPKKSHVVVAKVGDKVKTIRFGQQGVSGAGKAPKTAAQKARRKSFKARHAKNIAKGKMSAAYWANKVKWQEDNTMPMGKGTYGSQVGRPPKRKNSTDNYAQTQTGTGQNSTDNMNDGPIDRKITSKPKKKSTFKKIYESKMGRKNKDGKIVKDY